MAAVRVATPSTSSASARARAVATAQRPPQSPWAGVRRGGRPGGRPPQRLPHRPVPARVDDRVVEVVPAGRQDGRPGWHRPRTGRVLHPDGRRARIVQGDRNGRNGRCPSDAPGGDVVKVTAGRSGWRGFRRSIPPFLVLFLRILLKLHPLRRHEQGQLVIQVVRIVPVPDGAAAGAQADGEGDGRKAARVGHVPGEVALTRRLQLGAGRHEEAGRGGGRRLVAGASATTTLAASATTVTTIARARLALRCCGRRRSCGPQARAQVPNQQAPPPQVEQPGRRRDGQRGYLPHPYTG